MSHRRAIRALVLQCPIPFAYLGAFVLVACSGASEPTIDAWDCGVKSIPLGRTVECTRTVTAALSADGPSFYCEDRALVATCPARTDWAKLSASSPWLNAGTSDGVSSDGTSSDGIANGSGATSGVVSPGASSTGDSTGGIAGEAPLNPTKPAKPGTKPGTSDGAGSGPGGADGPAKGTNGGAGAGTNPGASSSTDGFGGQELAGFYCTREPGLIRCKRVPVCDAGAHRVQMDCEPDASISIGEGGGVDSHYVGGSSDDGLPGAQTQCFYGAGATPGSSIPAATFQYVLETFAGVKQLHMRLTFSPMFVDNSYGTSSVGWSSKGHKFSELVGSDHAELSFVDTAAQEKLHFKMDYLSRSDSAPSGYACLGVSGGEGRMLLGDASMITKVSSSLDRNLNERGYGSYVVDSPVTDPNYAAPASAPKWDFNVVYEAWIKNEAFGANGFGAVQLSFVHASPSKSGANTLPVSPGPCPPSWMGAGSGTSDGAAPSIR